MLEYSALFHLDEQWALKIICLSSKIARLFGASYSTVCVLSRSPSPRGQHTATPPGFGDVQATTKEVDSELSGCVVCRVQSPPFRFLVRQVFARADESSAEAAPGNSSFHTRKQICPSRHQVLKLAHRQQPSAQGTSYQPISVRGRRFVLREARSFEWETERRWLSFSSVAQQGNCKPRFQWLPLKKDQLDGSV